MVSEFNNLSESSPMSEALVSLSFAHMLGHSIVHPSQHIYDTKYSSNTAKAQANISFMNRAGEERSLRPLVYSWIK